MEYTYSILIPCYNPVEGWEKRIAENVKALEKQLQETIEIVLVNDGSKTGFTSKSTQFFKEHLPALKVSNHTQNRGKGAALRTAMAEASGKHIVFTDVDFPYKLSSILAVFSQLRAGADIVFGFREDAYYSKVPPFRIALSRLLRWLLKNALQLPITDTQCGLKGMSRLGAKEFLNTTINRFLFDVEFAVLASQNQKLEIAILPVELNEDVTFSKVPFKILLQESWSFLRLFFRKK